MITIEQIDEFRKRTNSSYGDAKYFLEKNQGDILEAIIDFENAKTGKNQYSQRKEKQEDFGKRTRTGFADILQKGFDTRIFIEDKNSTLFTIPVILLILMIPIWVIALLFFVFLYLLGYKFSIHDIKSQNVNISSFFQNISDKMKESGMNKEKSQGGPNRQNSQPNQDEKANVPAVSDLTPPVKTESQPSAAEPPKEEGYKEYTIE